MFFSDWKGYLLSCCPFFRHSSSAGIDGTGTAKFLFDPYLSVWEPYSCCPTCLCGSPYTYLLPYMSVRQPLCLFSALLVCTGALVPICCPTCLYGSPYTHLLPYLSVREPLYLFAALHVCTAAPLQICCPTCLYGCAGSQGGGAEEGRAGRQDPLRQVHQDLPQLARGNQGEPSYQVRACGRDWPDCS